MSQDEEDSGRSGEAPLSIRDRIDLKAAQQSTVVGTHGAARFALYAGLGVIVGAVVAALEYLTIEVVLHRVLHGPHWFQYMAPAIGLLLTAGFMRTRPNLKPATSDAFIQAFHARRGPALRDLPAKLAASSATIGLGGAAGMEGPAILAGSTIGRVLGDRSGRILGNRSSRILLVAGAAAGVSAVFKAPATGVLFALESPYRRDVTRYALIASLVASAASYLTFVLFLGSDELLRFAPAEVTLRDEIVGAVVLGISGGIAARGLALFWVWCKHRYQHLSWKVRFIGSSVTSALCLWGALTLVDRPVTLGPGEASVTELVVDPTVSLGVLALLFVLRGLATGSTLAGGGVGGVFIPLVVQGMLLGRFVEVVLDVPASGLYPVIGLAAVLGAAYRTPLAAVVFVAESTGRAEFVIPALVATAISQSMMGEISISEGQLDERKGRLERRLTEPVISVAVTDVGTVSPDALLLDIIDEHGTNPLAPAIPVADPDYKGLLVLHDMAQVMLEIGLDATAAQAMRDIPTVRVDEPALHAAREMNSNDTAAIAVVDDADVPVGVVSALSLAGLTEIT